MQIEENVSLARLTTVGLGGPARYLIRVEKADKLPKAIKFARDKGLPFLVIGGASNLLVADEGYPGVAIKMESEGISVDSKTTIVVESGTPLQKLVDYTIENGLAGIQRMTGIPGTVGGAIYGNAGAYGQMIGDSVHIVRVYDPKADSFDTLSTKECGFGYRESALAKNGLIILHSVHHFGEGASASLQKEAAETLEKRRVKYKPGLRCPGSLFKNYLTSQIPAEVLAKLPPREDTYGKTPAYIFLEGVGAKGDKMGGARIADFHANLFINQGGTAKDFWSLAKKWFDKVKQKYGIELESEVQFINLPPLKA